MCNIRWTWRTVGPAIPSSSSSTIHALIAECSIFASGTDPNVGSICTRTTAV